MAYRRSIHVTIVGYFTWATSVCNHSYGLAVQTALRIHSTTSSLALRRTTRYQQYTASVPHQLSNKTLYINLPAKHKIRPNRRHQRP